MLKRYSIRRARVADLDRIMEIERASFGRDAYDRNLFAEYSRKCGELFLVAERSHDMPTHDMPTHDMPTQDVSTFGKAWGYALTCLFARPYGGVSRKQAELISVAVHPSARGTGAAKALMDSTLRRLRLRGVTRLSLMVKVTNKRARAFYQRYGFKKIRIVRAYYEDGQDGWLMAKHL